MNHYEKIIQEKHNSKYHYKVIDEGYLGILKDEGQHKWTVQSWYGTNLLDEQRVIGPKSKAESAGERNIRSFEQRHRTNSKEEKDNSTVIRGTVHGHKYEVDRMSDGSYMCYVYDEDDFPIFKTGLHSTSSGAEQEIKSKVFNSKDNSKVLDAEIVSYSDPDTHEKYYKVWLVTDEGRRNPRVFKTFQEADREAARIQREVKSKNSKENSMNYYEKIVQEKRNSTEVVEKGTIKGVEYFIEKITETVKYPRPFEQVRYVGKVKKDGRVVNYTPKHERLDICKRAVEDLAQDYIHNSKEEKDNYEHPFEHLIKLAKQKGYPDLVKHLQEHKMEYLKDTSRIFARIKGLEGLPDKNNSKEEKTNLKLEKKQEYKGYIIEVYKNDTTGYSGYIYVSYQKGNPSKTHPYAYGSADSVSEGISRAKNALDVNNSKEKDNASVEDRFRHKGCMITILKKSENQYTFTIEQNGHEEGTNATYSTQDEAERKAKREVEVNWNQKEEKDNENFHYLGKTFSVTSGNFQQVRQQVQKAYWDKVKELEVKLRSAQGAEEQRIEKELREIREGYRETMEEFDRFNNSKDQGYYASIIHKKNSKESLSRAINLILTYLREGWEEDKIKRELKSQYGVSEEDIVDAMIAAKRLAQR